MGRRILITGGAGFIGSHLADELLAHGDTVRVLDNLEPQVHGGIDTRPDYLAPDVELVRGDVRDRDALERTLDRIDAVFHFAARVGVGQSMYEIGAYTSVNTYGTGVLLEVLSRQPVERLVVASSMSIYGEGLYRSKSSGALVTAPERPLEQLKRGDWETRGPDGEELEPVPTPETKAPALSSVYALSKYDQERLCLMVGRAYGMSAVALRFFNVYGPRQALSNPYTGVLAIFAARLLNGKPPVVFEDGRQRRDFVHVKDVARACRLALDTPKADGQVMNVGGGQSYSIAEIATRMAKAVGRPEIEPEINRTFRVGDIRHCFADIARARDVLGFEPGVAFEDGLRELAAWLQGRTAEDRVDQMRAELDARGLTVAPARSQPQEA